MSTSKYNTDVIKYGHPSNTAPGSLNNVVEDLTPQLGGDLDVNGKKIVSVSNGNIDIEPNGTGNVLLGNFTINADATIGAGQDNYVLTYDHGAGTWGPEAAAGGGLNNIVEDLSPQLGAALDGQGYDLNNLGVIFSTEQASAEADVAGKGQIWIKDDTPNELYYTDDAGTDRVISGLKIESVIFRPYDFLPATTVTISSVASTSMCLTFADSGVTYGQAHCTHVMPKRWDGGQMRWRFMWTPSTANTGSTQFYLIGHFQAEGDALAAGGTANMTITDTPNGTANDVHVSPWSSWQTVDGTGTEDKLFVFRLQRQGPTDAFTGSVNLLFAELQYTSDTMTDE